jgi:uncharacterized integral membrane protein (TIGR00698 family)
MTSEPSIPASKPWFTSEDWLAVWIGAALVALALLGSPTLKSLGFQVPTYGWANPDELFRRVLAPGNLTSIFGIGALLYGLSLLGAKAQGSPMPSFALGFLCVYLLSVAALVFAGQRALSKYGLEYVIWALGFGLAVSNSIRLPAWLESAARSELYIKIGLVILGSSVLFREVMRAGLPGILQALVVVLVVWTFAFWLAKRLRVDDEFSAILASAVSICGVSAAIAAAGAVQGDRKKLSYTTTIVVLVSVPMLVGMPWLVRWLQIDPIVAGAWLGGTLDTTASVTAAAELVGPVATKTGTIVKFSQNLLLGLAAFFLAIWWTVRENPTASERPSARVIWERFPKFVLGFMAVSLLFSFWITPQATQDVMPLLNALRTAWFALAFVSIGLEARLSHLVQLDGGRPALAFIGAQIFNVVFTLLIAHLLFGGVLLPAPHIE